MDKRAPLRQYYQEQDNQKLQTERHNQNVAQISALEKTLVQSMKSLVGYLDGHTTKTEVINQLKSISTPDVDKVVNKLSQVQNAIVGSQVDLKPLIEAVNGIGSQITIPEVNIPEQRESVSVNNLDEIKLDTSSIEKAIKDLKLDPRIDVKAPVINVKEPDLNPLKDILLNVVKAVRAIHIPEVPVTNLSNLEKSSEKVNKQLDTANKKLQELIEKPVGGGGGGGNATPYQTIDGKMSYVTLNSDGSVPTGGFDPSLDLTTDISTPGVIIETDGVKTLTTTYSSTSIMEVWS